MIDVERIKKLCSAIENTKDVVHRWQNVLKSIDNTPRMEIVIHGVEHRVGLVGSEMVPFLPLIRQLAEEKIRLAHGELCGYTDRLNECAIGNDNDPT